jgi:spore germination protein GerM
MKKRSKKKKGRGGILLFLVFVGVVLALVVLFYQDIFKSIKPIEKKQSVKQSVPEAKKVVLLYFSDSEGEYLIGEKREILKKDNIKEEAKEVMTELINGPRGKLIRTLPPGTKLLGLELNENGIAKVNVNRSLLKDHPGGSSAEMMTVYSMTNTLALNFPQIKRVQILIDGKTVETIAGHLSIKKPVLPNPDLIRK